MFAKLKKKIEEEVGDLGQLTSPLANPFASGDRRVGGSTQGTNTPNNLGSRQSSIASLVDIQLQPHDDPTSPSNLSLPVPLTPTPVISPRTNTNSGHQRTPSNFDSELKKVNAEWSKKYESIKKSYEERLQNQEADFAWKYGSKEEELEKVRAEKRKAEELIKSMEGSYQNKMTRVQDDMDQLEGFTKQETAKVKHLLLNTQADLQKAQADTIEQASLTKELTEENKKLKAENEAMLRNLDRDKLNRLKFEAEQVDTSAHLESLRIELQQRDRSITELRSALDASCSTEESAKADFFKVQAELVEQSNKLGEENKKLQAENETILKNLDTDRLKYETQQAETSIQLERLRLELQQRDDSTAELRSNLDSLSSTEQSAKVDLLKVQSDLAEQSAKAKQLVEENIRLKAENDAVLRNLDQDKLNLLKFKSEQAETSTLLETLRAELQQRANSIADLRSALDASSSTEESAITDLLRVQGDLVEKSNKLVEDNRKLQAEHETILRNVDRDRQKFEAEQAETSVQLENLQMELQRRDESIEELGSALETSCCTEESAKADLLKVQSDLVEQSTKAKELEEENVRLKAENESILRNLTGDKLNRLKFEAESTTQLESLQLELQLRDRSIIELRSALDASSSIEESAKTDFLKVQSDLAAQSKNLVEQNKKLKAENETILKNLESDKLNLQKVQAEQAETSSLVENLRAELQRRDKSIVDLRSALDASSSTEKSTKSGLLKVQTDLVEQANKAEELAEENMRLKAENEAILRNLDSDKLNVQKIESAQAETSAQIEALRLELQDRDQTIAELRSALDASSSTEESAKSDLVRVQSDLLEQSTKSQDLVEENNRLKVECETILNNLDGEKSKHVEQTARIVELEVMLEDRRNPVAPELKTDAEVEDVETFKERIRELETKLNDKNKALKLRQQQLQDLRKTLAKEMKNCNSSAPHLQSGSDPSIDYLTKSPSQTSLASSANDIRVEEFSQTENTEPAVIPSSNSHHLESTHSYANDVNFQYMKSVIFKFVTSPDPQVAHHLTKVVSTLLHLSEEECRILEKCTDKKLLTWLGSRDNQGF